MSDRAPQALLLDYAGVLTVDMWGTFGRFLTEHGLTTDGLQAAYRPGQPLYELSCELECGRVAIADFEPRLGEVLGIADHADLVARMTGGLAVEPVMADAIRRLRDAGVRLVLFSNSWGEAMYAPEIRELCHAEVLSGLVGMRKPDPEIYHHAVRAAGVPATACVFVDDQPVNLEPARELGIRTVHHTAPATTVAALERHFGVPLA